MTSCFNTAEVVIDNIVLLEILQRYKDTGVFGEVDPAFSIGSYKSIWSNFSESKYKDYTKTPAFFVYEDPQGYGFSTVWDCPKSLDEVLPQLITVMNEDVSIKKLRYTHGYNPDLYQQMKDELQQKVQEIKKGYLYVKWDFTYRGEELDGGAVESIFRFDPKNGENLETINYESERDDFDDGDVEDEDSEEDDEDQS